MNRYSWVCSGMSTPPHPARLLAAAWSLPRHGARIRRGGGEALDRPWPGAARPGGRVRACITHGLSHHLIWEAGLLHPSCKGEARQDCAVFPTGAPRTGPGSGHGDDPVPAQASHGGSPPRATHQPNGNKANERLPETRLWVPREGGRPPEAGTGRHYGGQRAML